MISERDVIGLLHRADWTKLTLSGTVHADEPVVDTVIIVQADRPPSGPWQREDEKYPGPPFPPPGKLPGVPSWMSGWAQRQAREARRGRSPGPFWEFAPRGQDARALAVAPGRRFRADGADGTWALGCDGARMWCWFRDRPASPTVGFNGADGQPRTPYRDLLEPSWLLSEYSLALAGEEAVAGRPGVRVRCSRRAVAAPVTEVGGPVGGSVRGLFAPMPRWISAVGYPDEVEAVVDAELGILLRCARRSGDEPPKVSEFTALDVTGAAGAPAFTAPEGGVFVGDKGAWTRAPGDRPAGPSLGDALGEALGTAGKEAATAFGGLAAGGLGALIRYAPSRPRVDPFAQATTEEADPEARIPDDEPAPDEAGPDEAGPDEAGGGVSAAQNTGLPDEVPHLLYRGGLTGPSFSATLHEWFDGDAVLGAIPESARRAGFGGFGYLVDALRDSTRDQGADAAHAVSVVRIGDWTRYRIDAVRTLAGTPFYHPGRRGAKQAPADAKQPLTIACDGTRVWQVYRDRVITGPAAPPPGDLAALVDASWLLDRDIELADGAEVELGGRRGYRVVARYRGPEAAGPGWWQRLFFPAVAVVDAETGLVLRLTRFKGGRPAMRQELRDFTVLEDGADFEFTPPAGLPVTDAGSPRSGDDEPGSWRAWSWDPPV